jgi:hypothetical protein
MDPRTKNFTTPQEGFEYATSQDCVAEIDRILNEMRRNSGVSALLDHPTIVSEALEEDEFCREGGVGGGYSPIKNRIRLDPTENFNNGYELLVTFIHERVHARGFNTFRAVAHHRRRTGEILEPDSIRIGYENYVTKEFSDFNEGMTELIAEEVYVELIRRQGMAKFVSGKVEDGKRWYAGYEYRTYEDEKSKVRDLVAHISETRQVSERTVWNAMKRGYFEGLDLGEILSELKDG